MTTDKKVAIPYFLFHSKCLCVKDVFVTIEGFKKIGVGIHKGVSVYITENSKPFVGAGDFPVFFKKC